MVLSGGASGAFVVLKDNWKYIEPSEKGRWPETYYPEGPSIYDYQLYNLNEDIGEQHNRYSEIPNKVKHMRQIINEVKNNYKTEANL
jgi:hypothetical protein